jgi:Prokaryotic phospholipase A2
MRPVLRVLVAVTSVLTVASPASAGPLHTAPTDLATIERLMYATPLASFVAAVGHDRWFDWSTDLCSAPLVGNTGRSFNFTNACRRHDFGYRNLQLVDRSYGTHAWNHDSRRRVDLQLFADMYGHCRARSWWDRPTCLAWARVFYAAVRVAGGP